VSDRDRLADFLISTQGRLARIAAGTIVILLGLGVIGGFFGVILLILGAIPIASAAYGTLLIGPLLGRDTMGRRPEDQPDDSDDEGEGEDEDEPEDASEPDEESSAADEPQEPDPDHEATPLARAERPPGQEPRTRDPRAEEGD
jgi:hypothetical protein